MHLTPELEKLMDEFMRTDYGMGLGIEFRAQSRVTIRKFFEHIDKTGGMEYHRPSIVEGKTCRVEVYPPLCDCTNCIKLK